jgi:hypothetical protein
MSALVMATIGCATGPFDSVASRFKYRIPFDVNSVQSPGADRVEVSELWGTRSKIEVGGDYLVVGTYSLQSLKQGRVCFYLTADGWDNSGSDTDLLRIDAAQGQGSFALVHSMPGPGDLHVSLSGWRDGDSIRVANVYLKNHEPRAGESAPNGRAP